MNISLAAVFDVPTVRGSLGHDNIVTAMIDTKTPSERGKAPESPLVD